MSSKGDNGGYTGGGKDFDGKGMPPVAKTLTIHRDPREPGDQKTYPRPGQLVTVHYIGYLAKTGQKFDSSLQRGQPLEFQLGANTVIRGFDEGVRQLSVGEKALISIPSELGYGSRGAGFIPPDADLIFELKLLATKDAPTENEEVEKFSNSSAGGSLDALVYLNKLLQSKDDDKLDLDRFDELLLEADVESIVSSKANTLTMLHIVSELAYSQTPDSIRSVISKLVQAGASLDALDRYGQTPLAYVLCCLEEDERETEEDDEAAPPNQSLLKAIVSYLELERQNIDEELTARVLNQIDRIPDKSNLCPLRSSIFGLLEQRSSQPRLEELRQGNNLVNYLCTFYDTFKGADPSTVKKFIDAGADPAVVQSHSGCNALHFVALNAYGSYDDVFTVVKMCLQRNPAAAAAVDRQKFTPFTLAADYKDTAKQFTCEPNACALLALGELLPQYDVDAASLCLRVDAAARECIDTSGAPLPAKSRLRFSEGDRVKCLVQSPGEKTWEEGTVVALWYREKFWPSSHPGAPYEVKLDIGDHVFALTDSEKIIKAESDRTSRTKARKRFIKQFTDDKWQMLDTVTGKAKPCSPPDSDSD